MCGSRSHQAFRFSSLAVALTLAGCSGGTFTSEPEGTDEAGAEVVEATEDVLSSFELGEQEVTFLVSYTGASPTEENSHLVLQVMGTLGAPDILGATASREGELTILEWFHALAPAELSTPDALVESHEVEAQAMGRSDSSVKAVAPWEVASEGAAGARIDAQIPQVVLCSTYELPVTPKTPGFIATSPYLCGGGKTGNGLTLPNAASCSATFANLVLTTGACIPTHRDLLTPQTGTATARGGQETVAANGKHRFVMSPPITLNVNHFVHRIHSKGANASHTVVSTATSSTDNLVIHLDVGT